MKTDQIIKIMKFLFWAIFIGLCIKTGSLIISFFVSLFVNPEGAKDLYLGLDLSGLRNLNTWYYINLMTLIIALAALKTHIAYLVTKIFTKINFDNPFNKTTATLLTKISHVALGTGILALIANGYNMWLYKRDLTSYVAQQYVEGSREFLFLAGIIFIIAHIFKKGIEYQEELEQIV